MKRFSYVFYVFSSFTVFFLLFLYFFHPVTNLVGDLGYYLAIGKVIVQTRTVPHINLFSYTNPAFSFINPNWLSEVLFYLIFSAFGWSSLIILSVVLIFIAFGIIFGDSLRQFNPFATIFVALLSIHILFERTEVKPELFSYLLFSIFIVILFVYKKRYTKFIFLLIPLQLLWVNLHIYFIMGNLLLVLFLVDALYTHRKNLQTQYISVLSGVTLTSFLINILNPNFLKGAFYPFFVFHNYAFTVEENINFFTALSYNTYDPTLFFYALAVILLWICLITQYKKMAPIDFLLAVVFTIMGFSTVRMFPLFIFGTYISFTKGFSYLLAPLNKKMGEWKVLGEAGFFIFIITALIPTIVLFTSIHGIGLGVTDYAQDAITFLKEHHMLGPIYNNYDIGNYLDYQFYPQEKVFADGRPEAYPKSFFENVYYPMQRSPDTFERYANIYHFNLIIIKHTDPSAETAQQIKWLMKSDEWRMIFLNGTVVIFLHNTTQNSDLIQKYAITESIMHFDKNDLDSKEEVRGLLNFFRLVGWDDKWLQMNLKFLEFEPHSCAALQNAAYILQKKADKRAPEFINRYASECL